MIWIYRILFLPLFLISCPYYFGRMIRRGGYAKDFSHRFGCVPALPPRRAGTHRLWIQAVSVGETEAVVRLTPAASGEDAPAGSVEVTVSTSDMRPLSLVYDYDGEQVAVRILRIAPLSEPLGRFDLRNYDGYELIDFR